MAGVDPPPVVGANEWDSLAQAAQAARPDVRVSVVLPAFEKPDVLARTLAGLSAQTYPDRLTQRIVVDDGSQPALTAPSGVELVRQNRDGFGLARARNRGAETADGDVLVFLDADMVPEPDFLEAPARWHHVCDYVLVMGFRRHADLESERPDRIAEAARTGSLSTLARKRDLGAPEWLEEHFRRTDEARRLVPDVYRFVTGGNFSIRRDVYADLGGTSEQFREYGGEDRELAFRSMVDGLVFVPERRAFAWHQGPGGWQAEDLAARRARSERLQAELIADSSLRRPGSVYQLPTLAVHLTGDVDSATGRSLVAGTFKDLVIDPDPVPRFIPIRMNVGSGVEFAPDAVERIVAAVRNEQIGRLSLTAASQPIVEVTLQRARRRAQRAGVARSPGFDVRTVDAGEFGVTAPRRTVLRRRRERRRS